MGEQTSGQAMPMDRRGWRWTGLASAVALVLCSWQAPRGVRIETGPEIPDPHPDPDPFPYPGHPARSPVHSELAHAMTKTLRQARGGATAALSLGRQHGCAPEQITIMPGDDCDDPLTAKMQPAIDKSREKLRKEVGDNFAGVHWTSGDGYDKDAFPYYERHGGYSGFGFHDIVYNGVHPTVYKPTIQWGMGRLVEPRKVLDSSHQSTTGTGLWKATRRASLKRSRPHESLRDYKVDNKHIAMLIAQGNRAIALSHSASPARAVRLLRDATADFGAAKLFKSRVNAFKSLSTMAEEGATLGGTGAAKRERELLTNAMRGKSKQHFQKYVEGLQNHKRGLLLRTISQISRLSSALRDSESASQQSIAELQRQTDAQTLDVKNTLAALDTAIATPDHRS